ncbi:MFS transporter [Bacillus marinisedimentorum]|uniref:MFS transporter n=1 Tax=Bacillus marinisedimentorum TaxID=1821260 RepID=UPI0007E0F51E|nr:MFS transporter [Bacillus marinisedimentorum]
MKNKQWDLLALASIPLVMTLGNSMFIPVLPVMEKKLDISNFQSSLIITVYSITAIILIPIAGYLSDKFGRKKIIIPSLIITAAGGALSAYAAWKMKDPYMMIIAGRFLQGIGASGAFPVVIPTVGDMFSDEEEVSKGLGLIETANTFGKVLSPIVGALLAAVIWFIPFASIPVLSIGAALLVMFLVRPPKEQEKEKKLVFSNFLKSVKTTFKENGRWLGGIFFIGGINMFILFGFLFHLSSVLEDRYKIEGVIKGGVLAVPLLFLCTASFLIGKKIGSNKLLMKWGIFSGNAMAALPLFFIKENSSLLLLLLFLTISGTGIGISLPCLDALLTEGIKKEERGTITSLYSSMRFIGVAAGPPAVAAVIKVLPEMIYPGMGGIGIVGSLTALFFIKPDKSPSQQDSNNALDHLDPVKGLAPKK